MNSKEIVERTLNFNYPERVARSFAESDLVFTGYNLISCETDWVKTGENRWEKIDEWGNRWGRLDGTSKGEIVEGVLKDIDDISEFTLPDFSKFENYEPAGETVNSRKDKWVVGGMPGFTFNIARKLFKLENYLCLLLLERDKIRVLHDRIDEQLHYIVYNYAKSGVDSIMFPEDWGTQQQTLVSPSLWYDEFYGRYKKLCELAHDSGVKVFMHSCGAIREIIPGLIDAGINLLQFDQPALHGIENLASYQKHSKITFWCPVDIQKTLQTMDETIIRNEAEELLDKLWQKKGGFIAGYYADNESIGLDPKFQQYACDEFLRKGII